MGNVNESRSTRGNACQRTIGRYRPTAIHTTATPSSLSHPARPGAAGDVSLEVEVPKSSMLYSAFRARSPKQRKHRNKGLLDAYELRRRALLGCGDGLILRDRLAMVEIALDLRFGAAWPNDDPCVPLERVSEYVALRQPQRALAAIATHREARRIIAPLDHAPSSDAIRGRLAQRFHQRIDARCAVDSGEYDAALAARVETLAPVQLAQICEQRAPSLPTYGGDLRK